MDIQELCAKLKQRREELGYNIEEVVEKTKLYPSAIRDLEEGNLSNISPAYRKGFIKIYASFLGVSAGDLVGEPSLLKTREEKRARKTASLKRLLSFVFIFKFIPPKVRKIIFFAVILAALLFGLIKAGAFVAKKISGFKLTHLKRPPAVSVKTAPTQSPSPGVLSRSQEFTAALTAKRDCFLRVKVDGKVLFEGMLKKGNADTWKGTKEIELRISDGSAVYLEVNGKPIPSLTSMRRAIKSLKINAQGISVEK